MALATDPIDTHGHTVADAVALYDGAGELALGADITLATSAAADDILDSVAHGLVAGDIIVFSELTGGAGLTVDTPYQVSSTSLSADTFRIKAATGGADLGFTTDITAAKVNVIDVASSGLDATEGDMYLAQSAAEVNAQIG
jgi:hypothetical protein